uniref:Scribbled n=1 Tax=Anopheles farauti TaxID=69004 RepID=A0A182QNL5_9DIPT
MRVAAIGREESKLAGGLSPLAKTPISRIPIRTANAEKRARAANCLPPEYDESKLSPSEIRALRAQKRAAWRQARLKSIENDALQAQIMIQAMNATVLAEETTQHSAKDGVDGAQPVDASPASPPVASSNGEQQAGGGNDTDHGSQQHHSSGENEEGEGEDGADRLARRFPRLAVKSRPGSEVVVRETETVVEEKVTRRTEEAPGGGVRTVEYIEKVIETEVETMREKIIVFELEDSSSGDSEEQQAQQPIGERVDESKGTPETDDGQCWPETEADGSELMDDDEDEDEDEEDEEEPQQEPEPVQLQTIVEVINPMLTGDGQPNDIAIGRYNDAVAYVGEEEDSLVVMPRYGAYEHGTYESINDKMKHVLRELKQNEKVRQNLSKSLTEDEIIALQAQEAEEQDVEEEEEEDDESERYEEKTGAIGTVFMVRERLINDFYTHQSELAQEQQHQQRKYQQQLLDDVASYHDCEVITNPNAERFSPPASYDNHSGPSQLYHQTLHSEKLKAVFGSDDEDEDDDEEVTAAAADQRNGNAVAKQEHEQDDEEEDDGESESKGVASSAAGTVTTSATAIPAYASNNAPAANSSDNKTSKRKKRKGKKKK